MSALSPQLMMLRPRLDDLPPVELPEGYTLRHYRPGDAAAWDVILAEAFGEGFGPGAFDRIMRQDVAFRPQRVLFVCHDEKPVATSAAWHRPVLGAHVGWLHYVAALKSHAGRQLGMRVSLACLHLMRDEGRSASLLSTDDFRVPAIVSYLKLGYHPLLVHDNQRKRWRDVFAAIARPELTDPMLGHLDDALYVIPGGREDMDSPDRFEVRRKWLPTREHRGGPRGGGDVDALGDESLYHPSALGRASVTPVRVEAGSEMTEPLVLRYEVGSAGLPAGATVTFWMRGQTPLGIAMQHNRPEGWGYVHLEGPSNCALGENRLSFAVTGTALKAGDVVSLRIDPWKDMRWNPVAARRAFRVVIDFGRASGEPQVRLPEHAVIDIAPGRPTVLEATLPATRRPGEDIHVRVTARDAFDNRVPLEGQVTATVDGQEALGAMRGGLADCEVDNAGLGVVRAAAALDAQQLPSTSSVSVPVDGLQLYIGDLHSHDMLSEAEGWCDELYRFAIEDRRYDFFSLAAQSHGWHDNDTHLLHKYMNERYLDEGRFVTLLAFEWQHSGYGDKVVHYLVCDQPYLPVDDARYDTPGKLYEALRGSDAMVISHHPAYPSQWVPGTDYDVVETDVERVIEIWSMHGSSEGYDPNDRPLSKIDPQRYVYAALRRGVRLGFVAGSDTHSGRPGGSAKEPLKYWGGQAAVWAPALTRRDIFSAIYNRHTYALTRARIVLRFTVNGALMGSEIDPAERADIRIDVWSPGRIAKIEIMKDTRVLHTFEPGGDEAHLEYEDVTGGSALYH